MNSLPTKILIADDTAEFGVRTASLLREMGYHTMTRRSSGSIILNTILSEEPDIVITDLTLRDTDAVALMNEVFAHSHRTPHFIVTSEIDNSFIEKQVLEGGADYFLARPLDMDKLNRLIANLSQRSTGSAANEMLINVTDTIQRLGVPAHIKGYHYLRTAILYTIEDPLMINSVTKQLYPLIAEKYHTTSSRVERAIRHAIETTWERAGVDKLERFFGCAYRGRPTNSEFIAFISDRLRLGTSISMSVFPQRLTAAL